MNGRRLLSLILGLFLSMAPWANALDTGAQNELAWRASELAQGLVELSREVPPSPKLQRASDAVRELQELVRQPDTTLAATGKQVDSVIRAIRELNEADTTRSPAWTRVIDGLENLQGQYESIRLRAGSAVAPHGVADSQHATELDRIISALLRVEKRAPSVLRDAGSREIISYLRRRVEFVRDHKGKLPPLLLKREYARLQEDAAAVRSMLQQQPYDDELGAAWRDARDRVAALTNEQPS